ncbi:prefoldin [Ephemerocybe angulata]|uniref:Prefoldin subunit 4 n=1 Tax=Ephemerocybe angulata TaxID=980116 RepID=A0A8H6IDA3_9AGAR|nr:prefoldin [Tulosesus angulatus]
MRMLEQEEEIDDGTEVTWEDQQRINTFSKLNARFGLIEGKLKDLKGEKEALDDLSMELELADEQEPVLYKIGEIFVHMRLSRALKRLEKDQERLDQNLKDFTSQSDECETSMKELKAKLYAKFGKSINLDE